MEFVPVGRLLKSDDLGSRNAKRTNNLPVGLEGL
ncbi:hypothetical protein ISN45_At05g028960 [Arabidopsis thaliana x Arabidopsis arenosa]|uniref:Uncharacterized protein n=2 Tax=Arabidopsis TaxID=3701 RepID=A0A8T2DIH4_ARASU|nr:hypothetical protein ISN45_At05g028960 [Arabidopsis thaliana x Arabidopsis arenosa]KAG7610766.1 hypothetical protein ISN44_As05g028410 [Arabidopsis suecica]